MKEDVFVTRARVKANLTQVAVATALGYESAQFISNIERGLSLLPNEKVRTFCELTGASLIGYTRVKLFQQARLTRLEIYG